MPSRLWISWSVDIIRGHRIFHDLYKRRSFSSVKTEQEGAMKATKTRKSRTRVSLSVKKGEKLSVKQGGGLTAKGRKKYNMATGSHLRAPAPHPKTPKDKSRRLSFCRRSRKWHGPRGLAARKRWNCWHLPAMIFLTNHWLKSVML